MSKCHDLEIWVIGHSRSLSRNSILGKLQVNFTASVHVNIIVCARDNANSFSLFLAKFATA